VCIQGPSGLGFAIVEENRDGRQGIYVRSITFGGVADRDTRLSVGDQILEVQDKSLQDVHYDKVYSVLFLLSFIRKTFRPLNFPFLITMSSRRYTCTGKYFNYHHLISTY
jgi:hypothetical protein